MKNFYNYVVRHIAHNAASYQSRCDAYPPFPRSPLGMPGTMTPILHADTKKKKKKETLAFLESRC